MPVEIIDRAGVGLDAEAAALSADIDLFFADQLADPGDGRDRLFAAMRHAAIGGGKRLRPLLVMAAARLFAIDRERALRAGGAVEAIHVYSLIHDDLPCMDDDDMRRGKPTVHKAFGEAEAVLAGDSLHAIAFEILADPATHEDPFVRSELVLELARAVGPAGMAGGQMMDLAAEGETLDINAITRLQQLKTGALIEYAVEAACIMGRLDPHARIPYRGYARNIGLAFQIADDLIDHCGRRSGRGQEAAEGRRRGQGDLRLDARRGAGAPAGRSAGRAGDRASGEPRRGGRSAAGHRALRGRAEPLRGHDLRIAVYPGTFDPITLGHLDIIRRGAHLVDKLVIGVTTNPSKEPMFSVAERLAMVRARDRGDRRQCFGGRVRFAADGFCRGAGRVDDPARACAPSPTSNMSSRWRG